MPSVTHSALEPKWPVLPRDTPIMYEDEEGGEMGEVNRHVGTKVTLWICLTSFLRDRHPQMQIFCNMKCYYAPEPKHENGSLPYISPDNMIVERAAAGARARKLAEAQAQKEAAARRLAEERLQVLQAELERLRSHS